MTRLRGLGVALMTTPGGYLRAVVHRGIDDAAIDASIDMLAVSAGALLLGLPMLELASPGVGLVAWLAGPAFVAIASARARSYW